MARTLTLFLIATAVVTTVSSHSIWSSDVCLSDLECPADRFCNNSVDLQFGVRSLLPRCDRRLPGDAACSQTDKALKECEIGFVCAYEELFGPRSNPRCLRRASRGEKCRTYTRFACKRPLQCTTKNSTCQPFTMGSVGKQCLESDECPLDEVFYCNSLSGVCEPRGGPGDKCNIQEDSFKCLGFCSVQGFEDGVCLSPRKEGELCTQDKQCANSVFAETNDLEPRDDPLVCNIPKGSTGRCVRKSHLLTRPGVKCDPDRDLCSRSLSCLSTGRGGYVCQHRGSENSSCDPKSSLSRCLWRDVKLECRLKRIKPTVFLKYNPSPFFACMRQSEKVARGGVCMAEYAACERGTECREVPGVLWEESFKYPPTRVAFCVRMVPKGAPCGDKKDKFTTQCGDGLCCENGTCVKAKNNKSLFDGPLTHAGLRASCADLPCVPGLVCEREEPSSEKLCILPLRIVGKGVTCVDQAIERRRCADGLVCAFQRDGGNVKRCRVPRKAGDYCEEDIECAEGLSCTSVWTESRERTERRCYDPKKTLNLGQACDPKASGSQFQCVAHERPDSYNPSETALDPMRCRAKGSGFVCRVVRQLFQPCDDAKDITCESGLHCGRYGVCVPVGET